MSNGVWRDGEVRAQKKSLKLLRKEEVESKIYNFRIGPSKIDFTKIGTKRFCSCNPICLKIYLSEIAMVFLASSFSET
jgi:hypothetical protein